MPLPEQPDKNHQCHRKIGHKHEKKIKKIISIYLNDCHGNTYEKIQNENTL